LFSGVSRLEGGSLVSQLERRLFVLPEVLYLLPKELSQICKSELLS
jgi:hypothetical protein